MSCRGPSAAKAPAAAPPDVTYTNPGSGRRTSTIDFPSMPAVNGLAAAVPGTAPESTAVHKATIRQNLTCGFIDLTSVLRGSAKRAHEALSPIFASMMPPPYRVGPHREG